MPHSRNGKLQLIVYPLVTNLFVDKVNIWITESVRREGFKIS